MTQQYMFELALKYVELYYDAYGFRPSDMQLSKYLNADADGRLAMRMKLQMAA